jgi:hypothetical protein
MFHQKICLYHGTNHQVDEENKTLYLDHIMLKSLGLDQVYMEASILISPNWELEFHVHICIIVGSRCNVGIKPNS